MRRLGLVPEVAILASLVLPRATVSAQHSTTSSIGGNFRLRALMALALFGIAAPFGRAVTTSCTIKVKVPAAVGAVATATVGTPVAIEVDSNDSTATDQFGISATDASAAINQPNAHLATGKDTAATVTFNTAGTWVILVTIGRVGCFSAPIQATAAAPAAAPADTLDITVPLSASYNTPITVKIRVVGNDGKTTDTSFAGTVTIDSTDPLAVYSPNQNLQFAGGLGYATITFKTPGDKVVSVGVSGGKSYEFPVSVNTTVGGCSSCFATIGAGAVATGRLGDYNNQNSVLEATHLGQSTPQYLLGVAYKLPIRGEFFALKNLHCDPTRSFNAAVSDGEAAFCYPFKVFINLKFSPDSSQTFNGFTFGLSHALHKYVDLLPGISYSAYNDISPGFRAAAVNVVTVAQQSGNVNAPCYAQWKVAELSDSTNTIAFDGFPTQLMTNTGTLSAPVCTAGAQIFSGSPLTVHYHPGFFIGISVPVSFKSFF